MSLGSNVSSVSNFPKGKHYAIITFSSIYIPGDERSRTNPGHGYPEHSETTCSYELFTDFKEFEAKVEYLTRNNRTFVPISAEVLPVITTVKVKVGE